MEIISVLLKGRMNHKDTMGYSEEVGPGWVQVMSAGTGLRHEEHNIGDEEVRFLQIWIEPKLQNIAPRYQRRYFSEEKSRNQLLTLVSNEERLDHCWINQNARIALGSFDAAHSETYALGPVNRNVFVYVISGTLNIAGQTLNEGDAIGIWEEQNIEISSSAAANYLLIDTPINH
jgi:hypothetical protein